MEVIIASTITGALALVGVIITNKSASDRMSQELKVHQAVIDTKIDHLTEEVRKNNNFAKRVPVLEEQVRTIKERIDDLK